MQKQKKTSLEWAMSDYNQPNGTKYVIYNPSKWAQKYGYDQWQDAFQNKEITMDEFNALYSSSTIMYLPEWLKKPREKAAANVHNVKEYYEYLLAVEKNNSSCVVQ